MNSEYKSGYISDDALDALFLTLNTFDANKVHDMMASYNWTWCDTFNGPNEVPEPDDIRQKSFNFLKDVYHKWWNGSKKYPYSVSSGGIEATYEFDFEEADEKYKHIFTLRFIPEESSNVY